jgi:hypothetical protein
MSNKEALIEWIRQLPDDYEMKQLLAALQERYGREQAPAAPAPEVDYEWPAPDLTEDEWRQVVANTWRESLEDPRDDIYTEEDGEASHGPG